MNHIKKLWTWGTRTYITQSAHGVVLTLIQRCLDVDDVVTTLKQRRVLTGKVPCLKLYTDDILYIGSD